MAIKLEHVLAKKMPGEKWFTIQAPEEFMYWGLKTPWSKKLLEDTPLVLLGASFAIELKAKTKKQKVRHDFSRKRPWLLSNGERIDKGFLEIGQYRKASIHIRVESIGEFNEIMKAATNQLQANTELWLTKKLQFVNPEFSTLVNFQRHNPDGIGISLFLYEIIEDKKPRLYPDLELPYQRILCGSFQGEPAICSLKKVRGTIRSCGLKHRTSTKFILQDDESA